MELKLLFLLLIIPFCLANEKFSFVGSRTIQRKSTYGAYLDTSYLSNDTAIVMQLTGSNNKTRVFKRNEKDFNGKPGKYIEFKLNEKNLARDYNLMILAHRKGKCHTVGFPIHPVHKRFSVFIQMDKPIYKPKDTVKFRVVLLDIALGPYKPDKLEIDIIEGKNNSVQKFNPQEGSITRGIYENSFDIAEEPNLGIWKITVKVNGRPELTEKEFEVKQYVLPLLDVTIDSNSYILQSDEILRLTISAKYSFGILAKGNVTVIANVYNKNERLEHTIQKKLVITTKKTIDFNVHNELEISEDNDEKKTIEIIVQFIDDLTRKKCEKKKKIPLRTRDSFQIQVVRDMNFYPGTNYSFHAFVMNAEGFLETSVGHPIHMECSYTYSSKSTQKWEKHDVFKPQSIENGATAFSWFIPSEVVKMDVNVTYRDSVESFQVIPDVKSQDKYFIATIQTNATLNQIITVEITSFFPLQQINYAVIGRFGVVHGDTHSCRGRKTCQFSFEPKSLMLPEANVIVYTIDNGNLIHYTVKLTFDQLSANFLKINTKNNQRHYLPGSMLTLDLETSKDSTIALLGFDEALTYLRTGNDIDKSVVREDLMLYGHTDHLIHVKDVENVKNGYVYVENFENMHDCTKAERDLLKESKILRRSAVDNNSGESDEEEEDYDYIPQRSSKADHVRKDFREVFIFNQANSGKDGKTVFETNLPDTITTWHISGFAMNKRNGFAIADPLKVTTIQNFFMKVHLPYSIKFGEILKIEVSVFSYIKSRVPLNFDVTIVTIPPGDTEQQFELIKSNGRRYEAINDTSITNSVYVTQNSATTAVFFVRPMKSGQIKIRIDAKSLFGKDSIEKFLLVEHEGTTYYGVKNFQIDLKSRNASNELWQIEESKDSIANSTKLAAVVQTSVAPRVKRSVASSGYSSYSASNPNDCPEQRTSRFIKNVISYNFLKARNLSTPSIDSNIRTSMSAGYQQILNYRRSDGSYPIWPTHTENVWMTTYVINFFGKAKSIININNAYITSAMDFIVAKRNSDGGYAGHNSLSTTYSKSGSSHGVSVTSFVIIAFLENQDLISKYRDAIDRTFSYLDNNAVKSDDNYAMAIAAYAYSLDDQFGKAEYLLQILDSRAIKTEKQRYWTERPGSSCSSIVICIEITSYVLLAHLKLEKFNEAFEMEHWLISQRNAQGTFPSSHCTVVALEALTEIGKHNLEFGKFVYEVIIKTDKNETFEFIVDNTKALDDSLIELPSDTRSVEVEARKIYGNGTVLAIVDHQYVKRAANVSKQFDLDVQVSNRNGNQAELEICTNFVSDGVTMNVTQTLIEIHLPSGYVYDEQTNLRAQKLKNFEKVEVKNRGTSVVLYFDKFSETNVCMNIKILRLNQVLDLKKGQVKIYDYYTLKFRATTFFSIDEDEDFFVSN